MSVFQCFPHSDEVLWDTNEQKPRLFSPKEKKKCLKITGSSVASAVLSYTSGMYQECSSEWMDSGMFWKVPCFDEENNKKNNIRLYGLIEHWRCGERYFLVRKQDFFTWNTAL
ncbi:Hypothetical predicted protein [Podarcis lilfordi]|uniref:Uncharacterized protein n=1 Tax=Podarcis lilfordi TaxID=74358 RepID=A0AA35L7N0_9SAUR|nr:Hypothetical predicted protein [Podarcis lilfordi]